MKKIFVDTNYFLRFLIGDVCTQQKQAENLFIKAADGKVKLFSNSVVLFEIFWVMSSFYEKSKTEAIKIVGQVLSMSFIEFQEREVLSKAIKLFKESTLELEDCYHIISAKSNQCSTIATFDKKIKKYWDR